MQGLRSTRHSNAKLYVSKIAGLQGWFAELNSASEKNYAKSPLGSPVKASDSSFGTEEAPEQENTISEPVFVGEDAAVFDLSREKLSSWVSFSAVLGVVLAILNYIWIDPKTGYGNTFIQVMSSVSENHEVRTKTVRVLESFNSIQYMYSFVLFSKVVMGPSNLDGAIFLMIEGDDSKDFYIEFFQSAAEALIMT